MSRTSSTNQNPYKESVPFFDTFSKEVLSNQTAKFKSSELVSSLPENDKLPSMMVLMGAEFDRLHGIIQVLILRYKDLESKYEESEKEKKKLQGRLGSLEDSAGQTSELKDELERSKSQISELIVQLEEAKTQILEKDHEISSLRNKTQTQLSLPQTVKTEGLFATAGREEIRKKENNYNSEPLRTSENDMKNYEYYSKLYEFNKGANGQEKAPLFYSGDKQMLESPGMKSSGDYRQDLDHGDYKYNEYKQGGYYPPEEEFSKKYGSKDYGIPEEDYSAKKYSGSIDEGSSKKIQGHDYSNQKFGAYDYKLPEASAKKFGSQDDEYSSQRFGDSDYKRPEDEFSAQKFGGGFDIAGDKLYGNYEDFAKKYGSMDYSKQEEDYSKKYGLDLNKPSGSSLKSRDYDNSARIDEAYGVKALDFDYKKGFQYQFNDEARKF